MVPQKERVYQELLVLRSQQGDREAIEELIHIFEKQLFYYISRLVENEADVWNILQETWLKMICSIKYLRDPKKLPAWLYSIARKTLMSYLRSKYSEEALFGSVQDSIDIECSNKNLSFDSAEQVHYGLNEISLPHREVLTLFFLQDLTLKQIANVLNISIGTVKSRLYYAKLALKAVLTKEGNING